MERISKSSLLHRDCTRAQGYNEGIPLSMQTNSSRMVKAIRFCFRGVRGVMGHALSALVALEELKSPQTSWLLAMLLPLCPSFRTHPLLHITAQTQNWAQPYLKQDLNFFSSAKFLNLETKLLQSFQ